MKYSVLAEKIKRLAEKQQQAALLLTQLNESVALHALVGRFDGSNQMEVGEFGRIGFMWYWNGRLAHHADYHAKQAVTPSGEVRYGGERWTLKVRTGIDTDQMATHSFKYEDVPDALKPTLFRAVQ